jgi:hypothetical protein
LQLHEFPGLSLPQLRGATLRESHALGPIVPAGLKLLPLGRAPEALRGWHDYVADALGRLCQLASFSRQTSRRLRPHRDGSLSRPDRER